MANSSVCLESSLRCYTPEPEPFVAPVTLSHTATIPLQTRKVRNSSRKRRETKTLKDSARLVALCASLPSGAGATAHRVRCQSLSNTGQPSNPIQWQREGLAATHITYMRAVSAHRCQPVKAPAIERSLLRYKDTNCRCMFTSRGGRGN